MVFFFFDCAGPLLLPDFSLVEVSEGYSLGAVHGLLTGVASLAAVHRLQSTGAVVAVHGLLLRGMWEPPDQGLNPCCLHWQANSLPLNHQNNPLILFYTSDLHLQILKNISCIIFIKDTGLQFHFIFGLGIRVVIHKMN